MEKILFDSHTHINDELLLNDNLKEMIEGSALKYCVNIGCDIKSSIEAARLSSLHDFCFASVGVHPSELSGIDEESLKECLSLYQSEEKVVAIGEIGLDYHYDDGPSKDEQRYWFKKQLDIAIRYKAPVCIHTRDADLETLNILKESGMFSDERVNSFKRKQSGAKDARVLIHCFGGSYELYKEYRKLGASISLGGVVTFKNARKAVEVASMMELEDLLLETDAPYMAPEPKRGTKNNPCNIYYVAKKIAELRNMDYEEIARITYSNAVNFYNIKE